MVKSAYVFLLLFWTPRPTEGTGDVPSPDCYMKEGYASGYGRSIGTKTDIANSTACARLCSRPDIECDTFIYYKPTKKCYMVIGELMDKTPSTDSVAGWCPGKGKNSGPSKLRGLKCGGQDVCQARGLHDLFGGKLGCVDNNGNEIPASACSASVEEDTEYLKCGEDCFVACQDTGSDSQVYSETFKGRQNSLGKSLSKTGCKALCKLAEGCTAFRYIFNDPLEECTLKYNKQETTSLDTCKEDCKTAEEARTEGECNEGQDGGKAACGTVDRTRNVTTVKVVASPARYGGKECDLESKQKPSQTKDTKDLQKTILIASLSGVASIAIIGLVISWWSSSS